MSIENGEWVLYGVKRNDPACIHTAEQLIDYVSEVGFLPLFGNAVPGFSVEERTVADDWWSGDVKRDPWEWREIIARSGEVAYGKFFDKKAGFISKEWFPYFVNYRRNGYDFDARWDDGLANIRHKKIMDLFMADEDAKLYSFEIKKSAGFGKGGEKNFDGMITELQMQTYLVMRDFGQRKNKTGQAYGWSVAIYSTPEHLWGYDYITSAYKEDPEESGRRIYERVKELYPDASQKQIQKVIR